MDVHVRAGGFEASFSWRRATVILLTALMLVVGVYQVLNASRALGRQLGFENRSACVAAGGHWDEHADGQSRHAACVMKARS